MSKQNSRNSQKHNHKEHSGMVLIENEWYYKFDLSKSHEIPQVKDFFEKINSDIQQGKTRYCPSCNCIDINQKCLSPLGEQWVYHEAESKGMICLSYISKIREVLNEK